MKPRNVLSALRSSAEFNPVEMKKAVAVLNKKYIESLEPNNLKKIFDQYELKWELYSVGIGEKNENGRKEEGFMALLSISSVQNLLIKLKIHMYFNELFFEKIKFNEQEGWFYFTNMKFLMNVLNLEKLHSLSTFLNAKENYQQPVFNEKMTERALPWYVEKMATSPEHYQLKMFSRFSNPVTDRLLLSRFGSCITMRDDGSHFIHDVDELERLKNQKNRPGC